MKFKTINVYLVFLVCAIASSSSTGRVAFASVGTSKEEDSVDVSPECAVVLVTAGSVAGGLASFVLIEPLLFLVGFTGAGIAEGSFAAWWQSTMPNVMAGSLFSSLQSITMTGVESNIIVSSSIGGAATASQLRRMCGIIDDVDPESKEGKVISSLLVAEEKIGTTWEQHVKPNLEAGMNYLKDTASVAEDKIGTTWEQHVKPNLEAGMNDLKDTVSVAEEKIGTTWEQQVKPNLEAGMNNLKDTVSVAEEKIGTTWEQHVKPNLEAGMNDLKDTVSDTWNKIKDRRSKNY
jgi:hypothetical protein